MGKKKLGLSSLLFRLRDAPPKPSCYSTPWPSHSSSSWPWPSCRHPKTDSFRDAGEGPGGCGAICKTVNSVCFDSADSIFTRWSSEEEQQDSFSTVSEGYCFDAGETPSVETMVRELRSDRLFFEPGDTSSILEESNKGSVSSGTTSSTGREFFGESVALVMESDDPYRDFRASMEEMVAAHELKDWERLEELLLWYLSVNGKKTHAFIVGAFVDLLVDIANSLPPSSTTTSSSSPSPNISFEIEEIIHEHKEESSGSS